MPGLIVMQQQPPSHPQWQQQSRLSPLTSVKAALLTEAGTHIAALPHVALAISGFLDHGLPQNFWSLPRACEANLLSFLPRLAAHGISTDIDPFYWRYQCGQGLVSAVKHGNLEMVEWLHECCPSVLPYNPMVETARTGNVLLLEWLSARRDTAVWLPQMMDAAASTGRIEGSPPGAIQLASQCIEYMEVVQWLYAKHPRSVDIDKMRWNDSYMAPVLGLTFAD